MSERVKATARKFFEGQDRLRGGPDPDLCGEGYNCQIGSNPLMNFAGHRDMAAVFYAGFPDMRHVIQEVLADGDRAIVRFRIEGTNTASFMGMPPSGRPIDVGAIVLMKVRDGKAVEIRAEFDQLGLMQQIGAFPAG
jgi:predicted ester cyclase